jgi:hypothetical protein
MEEVEVEIILPEMPEVARVVDSLAAFLGLELETLGMTSTFDRLVDTADYALLSQDNSLRVRQKLDNMYEGSEFRLTYKVPLRSHERLLIREESKLKLSEPDFEPVLGVLSNVAHGVSGQRLGTVLEIRELAREANLGPAGAQVNVSVDQCAYYAPGAEEPGAQEVVFEIESHGVDDEVILSAADWVIRELKGREAAESKYARGLRMLGML